MTIVLSIGQNRALVRVLADLDDRKLTMYQKGSVLVVDPSDPRGKFADDRMFYIQANGVVSNEFVEPVATPEPVPTEQVIDEPPKKEKKKKKKKTAPVENTPKEPEPPAEVPAETPPADPVTDPAS